MSSSHVAIGRAGVCHSTPKCVRIPGHRHNSSLLCCFNYSFAGFLFTIDFVLNHMLWWQLNTCPWHNEKNTSVVNHTSGLPCLKEINPSLTWISINLSNLNIHLGVIYLRQVFTALWCYLEQTVFHPVPLACAVWHYANTNLYVCSTPRSEKSGTEQNSWDHITGFLRRWSSTDGVPNFIYFFKFCPAEIKED